MPSAKRCFPGRLTLEEWAVLPWGQRSALIWRAQCDLLGSFRHCTKKRCRRERTCWGEDPHACGQRIWRLTKPKSKRLWREWARLRNLERV